MKILPEHSRDIILASVELLHSGGVVIFPTETVYGLGCLWRNHAGRERIYELKKRPADKRLQMLAASLEQAAAAGVLVSDSLRKIAAVFWPGPLTVVVPATDGDSIGLRIPAQPFLLRLLEKLEEPLAATSANLSGQPPASTATEAPKLLNGQPDLVIDGGQVSTTNGAASTVVSLTDKNIRILREGPITLAQLEACLL
jgi:L-threonylcarbamoyladenylate synthase